MHLRVLRWSHCNVHAIEEPRKLYTSDFARGAQYAAVVYDINDNRQLVK